MNSGMKMLTLFVLLCAGMLLTNAADDGCPVGWSRYDDRCFLYNGTAQTWDLAEMNCQVLGGNLSSIHSDAEENFVKMVIQNATNRSLQTWIGGSDIEQEGVWLWSDSSNFTFTNWCPGEPNNSGDQHCLQMNYGIGKCWDDLSCNDNLPSVCARRALPTSAGVRKHQENFFLFSLIISSLFVTIS